MPVCAETLFEVIFQQLLEAKKSLIPQVDAVVMVTVIGEGGGVWTLDMRKGGDGKVHRGAAEGPDLTLVLAHDFLENFLVGTYDAQKEMEAGRLGIVGSTRKLNAFVGFLLSQAEALKQEGLSAPQGGGVQLRK